MVVISAVRTVGSGGGEVVLESILSKAIGQDVVVVVKKGQKFKGKYKDPIYLEISPWLVKIGLAELGFDYFLRRHKINPKFIICLGDIPIRTKYHQVYYYDWFFLYLAYDSGLSAVPGIKRKFKFWAFLFFKKWINSFVCQNTLGKVFIETTFGKKPIVSLPFCPKSRRIGSTVSSVIYPSSGAAYKRHDLLRNFALDHSLVTFFVTLNDSDYKKLYFDTPNVVNLGWLSRSELVHVMMTIDAVGVFSDYESLCLPVLEAVELGKPIFYRGQDFVDCLVENPYFFESYEAGAVYESACLQSGLVSEDLLNINYEAMC